LTREQLRRFNQIALQDMGARAFQEPDVIAYLELNDEQRSLIRTIRANEWALFDAGTDSDQCPPDEPGGPPRKVMKRDKDDHGHHPIRFGTSKNTLERIVREVLTEAQAAKWQELTGKPFEHFPLHLEPPGKHFGGPPG
jgi:hypothetical protein